MKKLLALFLLLPSVAFAEPGRTKCVSATPTLTVGAYATGQSLGTELTFTNLLRNVSGSGYVASAIISDKAAQAVDIDLELSRSSLTGTTFTDVTAFDPADTDLSKIIMMLNFGSGSRYAFADNGVKYLGGLGNAAQTPLASVPSPHLYGSLIARGAYTAASTSDLTVTVCVAQD